MQEEYVDGVEKHDRETQATIERERITTAAVKQLKAEIKDEKSKHEEEVWLLLHSAASVLHQQHSFLVGIISSVLQQSMCTTSQLPHPHADACLP